MLIPIQFMRADILTEFRVLCARYIFLSFFLSIFFYSISFNRIPKNEIVLQMRDQSIANWQNEWDHTTKGLATKQFFPIIKDRLTTKIKLTPNFRQ
jgi:hypothetical protein